jgi:hypothetical protein
MRRLLSSCFGPCLLNAFASSWVDLVYATVVSREALQQENSIIRMGALQRDLDTCYERLATRESELEHKVDFLAQQAVAARRQKKMDLARRKMVERSRVVAQLERIRGSMGLIDVHKSTIEGTTLDISVLETLKASGDALKQMGVNAKGMSTVDDIVTDVESSLKTASEISAMLTFGNAQGVEDSNAFYGAGAADVDTEELMAELEEMMQTSDGEEEFADRRTSGSSAADRTMERLPTVPSGMMPIASDASFAAAGTFVSSEGNSRRAAAHHDHRLMMLPN